MDVREKLVKLLDEYFDIGDSYAYNLTRVKSAFACGTMGFDDFEEFDEETVADIADHLIANGVTVQEWIPASKPPQENGYYLCVVLISACGNKKKFGRKILYWEDNVWIEKSNSFRIEKPLHWMPMAEMPLPQPPEGE